MVDLGQKKVDSYPPFFMSCCEQKNLPHFYGRSIIKTRCNYLFCAYLADTSCQLITLKNSST